MGRTKTQAALWPSNTIVGLAALQVIFAVVSIGVTTGNLDQGSAQCYLNLLPGRTCDFVYVTSGFGILFSLTLLGTTLYAQRAHAGKKPVLVWAAIHQALFAGLWYIPLVVQLTVRGGQVDGERSAAFPEGYPYKTERTAVIALAYIIMIFFYAQAFLGIADRWINSKRRFGSEAEEQFIPDAPQGFAHTRALAETPVD